MVVVLVLIAAFVLWPVIWGFGFGLWEKRSFAPARRIAGIIPGLLSAFVAACGPLGLLALERLDGTTGLDPSFFWTVLLFSAVVFVICWGLTTCAFQASRLVLRTRFDTKARSDGQDSLTTDSQGWTRKGDK